MHQMRNMKLFSRFKVRVKATLNMKMSFQLTQVRNIMYRKMVTKWNKNPLSSGRMRLHNIMRIGNKGTKRTLDTSSPLSIFKSFMTEKIVSIIIRETNSKAEKTLIEQNKT
uniref:Uncharacterized protein n=1 Tax=Cacopsylla melanoneura TaxID=428564 RepID=A0A8D8REI9_9HEMI